MSERALSGKSNRYNHNSSCDPSFVTLKFNIFRSLNFKKIWDYYIVLEDNNT